MRLALILLVVTAVLVPAARADAACTPLDPTESTYVSVRKPPGYRAFIFFDCVNGPTGSANHGNVGITDATGVFTGAWLVEYQSTTADQFDVLTVNGDGQQFTFDILNTAMANTSSLCLTYNEPVLGLDERALVRAGCWDADGDQPALAAGPATLGWLSAPLVTGSPVLGVHFTLFDSTYTLTQIAGPGVQTVPVGFTVDDGRGPVAADALEPFAVSFPAEQAPGCTPVSVQTAAGTAVSGQLPCSDPDPGDAITIFISAPPAHGTLSAVAADGTVTYVPAPGWAGSDSFTFAASDGRALSAPATATVVTTGGGAPPPPPGKVSAAVANNWIAFRTYVKVGRLVVRDAPADASVQVRCSGRGCPYRRRTIKRRSDGTFSATKGFRGRKLREGAVVEVRVLVAGSIGKVVRYRIKPPKTPKGKVLCLPPGATRPAGC
jgi:hypothetical protein